MSANADTRIILTAMSVGKKPFKVNFPTHIFTPIIWIFKQYAHVYRNFAARKQS